MNWLRIVALLSLALLTACASDPRPTAVASRAYQPVRYPVDPDWVENYETRLQAALKGTRFEVLRQGSTLVVTAPVDYTFNPDRPHMLLPASLGPLTRIAKMLEVDPTLAVAVLGHTDSTGSAGLNQTLSQNRATAVGSIFALSGLRTDRLLIQGMGSSQPRASNGNQRGRAMNRRVDMVLTPRDDFRGLMAQLARR